MLCCAALVTSPEIPVHWTGSLLTVMSSVPMEDFEQRSGRQVVDWGGENDSEELWVRGGRDSSGR